MLTYEDLIQLHREFSDWIERIKTEDLVDGLCICDNCFGDRQVGSYLKALGRRRCLENPRLLTDLGNEERRK